MFRMANNKIYIDCYGLEVYLPYDYLTAGYRGTQCYQVVGTKVKFYGIGNMKAFKDKKEMDNSLSVTASPLGIPMIITSCPSEIDTREVQFVKNGVVRKCIVLTYYKDDVFADNTNLVQSLNHVMILMNRLEGGKLDHIVPDVAVQILQDAQRMNKVKLRIPTEEEEVFIAERYRNPDKQAQKARMGGASDPDKIVSYNMRQDAMKTTTYQALTHEDINTALIVSANRYNDGTINDPTIMERIVRGMDLSDLIEERDRRLEKEQSVDTDEETEDR